MLFRRKMYHPDPTLSTAVPGTWAVARPAGCRSVGAAAGMPLPAPAARSAKADLRG